MSKLRIQTTANKTCHRKTWHSKLASNRSEFCLVITKAYFFRIDYDKSIAEHENKHTSVTIFVFTLQSECCETTREAGKGILLTNQSPF